MNGQQLAVAFTELHQRGRSREEKEGEAPVNSCTYVGRTACEERNDPTCVILILERHQNNRSEAQKLSCKVLTCTAPKNLLKRQKECVIVTTIKSVADGAITDRIALTRQWKKEQIVVASWSGEDSIVRRTAISPWCLSLSVAE